MWVYLQLYLLPQQIPTSVFYGNVPLFGSIRIAEMVDSQRDLCADLMATYLSLASNRMNEVMKVLSIIGTIFIPLSFIAGLYGMNFDPEASPFNMPELGWYLGYPIALLMMGAVAVGLLAFFWKRGWFE